MSPPSRASPAGWKPSHQQQQPPPLPPRISSPPNSNGTSNGSSRYFWLHSIVYFNSKFKWLSINDANPFRGRGILGCFIKIFFLFSNLYLLYCEQYGKIFTHTKNQLKILKKKYSPRRLNFIVLS